MNITQQIKEYLIANPIDRSKPNCYKPTAEYFGVNSERVRSIYKRLRRSGLVENQTQKSKIDNGYTALTSNNFEEKKLVRSTTDTQNIEINTSKEVKTLDDLVEVCDIDESIWDIHSWQCRSANGRFTVEARLKLKNSKKITNHKDLILKELYDKSLKTKSFFLGKKTPKRNKLLEISIPDIHFGKLAHADETGEDYDIKIAEERFKSAVNDLLSKVNLNTVERIFFPIGNDLINFDNKKNTTVNLTPQDSDSRFFKVLRTVKRVLVETIDYLSTIAITDVMVVPGNHDETITFTIGEILDAYYHNNENVNIYNSPKLRKYYEFGKVAIQLTHGDKESHLMLGSIFANEEPELWGRTLYRYCQLGHFHKSKKISFIQVDEYPGFEVQIIPSLSGTDAFHASRGYNSLKRAKAFLFDPEKGLEAEYTFTI
ncbi:hypothetical protein [Leptolyngbya phage Lbo-JY46]